MSTDEPQESVQVQGAQWTPQQLVWAGVSTIVLVGVVTFVWSLARRRRKVDEARAIRVAPAVAFLKLLSTDEPGSSKKFSAAFHPSVPIVPGVLRGMQRAVISELGAFQHLNLRETQLATASNKTFGQITIAKFKATFAKSQDVPCEVSWTPVKNKPSELKPDAGAPVKAATSIKITHFHVSPHGRLDIMPFLDPRDFEDQGEKWLASAFSNHPTVAHAMLGPTLKAKMPTEEALNKEMVGVLRAVGGLKHKKLDMTALSAMTTTVQERQCMVLELLVKGELRDISVKLTCALNGTQFVILAFTFTALASSQKHVFVEK